MRLLWISLCFASALLAQKPAIYVAGDSTASNGDHLGWGDPFADYFDASKVDVYNRARAGRSARTYMREGLWDAVAADLKQGDVVLIQFGHNDGGALDQPPYRGDLRGVGEETQTITNPDGTAEVVHTFGWYIRKFVTDAKVKGATPIVLSPTVRNEWKDAAVERGTGGGRFGRWSQQVADEESVPFLDATNIIADAYEVMGQDKIKPLFPIDHTHTSQEGADLNASLIVSGLKGMRIPLPLAQLLSDKGRAVTLAPEISRLHLPEPTNANLPTLFLIGDSTVRNGSGKGDGGQWGWGNPLFDLFDETEVNVVNRAVGGLSSRTFYEGPYWRRVLDMMKPGDYVVMQFGHNDNGDPSAQGSRASIRGVGDEAQGTAHSFGWYLRQYIAQTRARGATPIVASLVPRKTWQDGKIVRNDQDYGKWAAEVARSEATPFIDLNELVAREYDKLGAENVDPLFADQHTHTSWDGAVLTAKILAEAIRQLTELPLAGYAK